MSDFTLQTPSWTNLPVSIDIESVGLADSAPIFAIGAVRFTENGSPLPKGCPGEFYELINLKGQGPADADTLIWWLNQPDEVRAELGKSQQADQLYKVLGRFHEWLLSGYSRYLGMTDQVFEGGLWVRGNRDSAWLEHAYKSCGMPLPYRYNKVGDQRTLLEFAERHMHLDVWLPRETPMHHALHDARYQAECLQQVFKRYPNLDHIIEPE